MEREPCGGDYYVEFREGLEREITGEPIIFYLLRSLFYRFVLFKGKGDCSWTRKKDNFFQSYDIIQVIDGEPSQSSRFSHSVWQELRLCNNLLGVARFANCRSRRRRLLLLRTKAFIRKRAKQSPLPRERAASRVSFFK